MSNESEGASAETRCGKPEMLTRLTRPVFFVGFMGAGKSSVARRLARKCGISSVDMDKYIERREGKKISDIFNEQGEEGFRDIETQVLKELSTGDEPMLISCGGGIVVKEENRELLRQGGFVVHLEVDADEASSRIRDKSSRPLFNDLESARKRCSDRLPLYEEVSDLTIRTGGKSVYEISMEALRRLEKEGILCPQ